MIDKDRLAESARYNDARCEEFGLIDYCARINVDVHGLRDVAEQRALRVIMSMRGENPNVSRRTMIKLNRPERRLLEMIAAASMDGIMIGINAKELDA